MKFESQCMLREIANCLRYLHNEGDIKFETVIIMLDQLEKEGITYKIIYASGGFIEDIIF